MPVKKRVKLSEQEQDCLVHAIEAAIEVHDRHHFHAWIRGPFHALIPHDNMVCVEVDGSDNVRRVEFIHHDGSESASPGGNPRASSLDEGLAVRMVQSVSGNAHLPLTVDAESMGVMPLPSLAESGGGGEYRPSAVIHRTKFVSGAAYYFVLFNVPPTLDQRSHHLLTLLSSHLKMALSRVIELPQSPPSRLPSSVTARELEILRWMQQEKSNQEISVILGISPLTLKSHVKKIYRKLDVHCRVDAIARALSSQGTTE